MNKQIKSSFPHLKKQTVLGKKIAIFLLFFILFSSVILAPVKPAKAIPVEDIPALIWNKVTETAKKLWQKGGSLAFQQTLRSSLNKIAYDSANWIGSGGEGQKPLFVTQDWGDYMAQVGDEAAGTFLEKFTSNLADSKSPAQCAREYDECFENCVGQECVDRCQAKQESCNVKAKSGAGFTFNYCQPSSLEAKVKIGLGLSQQKQPQAPPCTASKMIQNWSDAAAKYKDFKDPQFLNKLSDIFDPTSSEIGIWWTANSDMLNEEIKGKETTKTTLLGKGGWLDPRTIDGESRSLPNQAQLQAEGAYEQYSNNFGKYTGDAFIDAAQLFLNQLSLTAFNKLMQNLGTKSSKTATVSSSVEQDPNYGQGDTALKDVTSKIISPQFGEGNVYDILSELAVCPDKDHPGPSNCVIDSKFMQAISERKTVAEALKGGYLHGDWSFTLDNKVSAYENSYSYRNISILKTHRIVPASWESVFEKLISFRNDGNQKKVTLNDLVSCFNPYDEYNKFSQGFDAKDQAWCTGLVDPNWVLKAPLNFCKKEGFSAQIINKNIIPSQKAYGDNPYVPSELNVIRAEDYCADNQTCIKEDKNGGCLQYGYCNEEKRTWDFDGESCEPINNTCQAFINPENGQKVAYLQNTLDYGACGPQNAGCKRYSYVGAYDALRGMTQWNESTNVYLNKSVENCSSKDEGCSEFIRIKPTWGANLVMNSDFAHDDENASSTTGFLNDWPVTASRSTIVNSAIEPGLSTGKALKLEGTTNVAVHSNFNNSLLPDNFQLVPGQAYTLSADIWLVAGSGARIALGSAGNATTYESNTTGSWVHMSLVRKAGSGFTQPSFSISAYASAGSPVTIYIKNIKFEMSNQATGYSSYGSSKVYQKLLPQYLESTCYSLSGNGAYTLKDNAPKDLCGKFARKCNPSEVGCELYSSTESSLTIPAKIDNNDYCDGKCVGYDVYIARQTYFNSPYSENLIPQTAKGCSADAVGCNEFTNLDAVDSGGENKEYYSVLKQCVKPSQAVCGSFYAWEGTGNGYQLKLYNLQMNANGSPVSVNASINECNEAIFNEPVNSPLYNADCQQLYTSTGQVFYNNKSDLITCSESCRAYRMTEKNYDGRLSQAECTGINRSWDANEGACISCLNGGVWNNVHQACVYQGIPGEGKTCSAEQNGCREYNGNKGNNVRLVGSYNFETPSSVWTSNCDEGINISTISSDKDGHSLHFNNNAGSCSTIGWPRQTASKFPLINKIMAAEPPLMPAVQLSVSTGVKKDKAYTVRFLASSPAGADLDIYFYNPEIQEMAKFNTDELVRVSAGGGWQMYSANLENLGHEVSNREMLVIASYEEFYIDDFILTEITDRYYLVKSSSEIPAVCYYDNEDNYQGPDYNLGCSAYVDRSGVAHNLHSFSSICDRSSVGCEQVISTQNYDFYGEGIWGDVNNNGICDAGESDCIKVDGDKAMYIVYDEAKSCNVADLGCSLLGQAKAASGNKTAWSDVYKKNNPNKYNDIRCESSGLNCEEWKDANGSGLSYFRNPGDNVCVYYPSQKAWYKKTASGEVPCSTSFLETIGYGGEGNRVPVPINDVASCDIKSSGCTEYIDPVSKFNPVLLPLEVNTSGLGYVNLTPNKLYSIYSRTPMSVSFEADIRVLQSDNTFGPARRALSFESQSRYIFNSLNNTTLRGVPASSLEIRELAIEYQIADSIKENIVECNGLVDFNNGCILFNERKITGASGYVNLNGYYDPYTSKDKAAPVNCSLPGSCTSNLLVKARPDRTCSGWLDCSTFIIDPKTGDEVCFALSQCNNLNEKGECDNFVETRPSLPDQSSFDKSTGYFFLNKYNISQMKEVGLNSEAHFDFEEPVPSLSCTRIIGGQGCSFTNIAKELIVREPEKAKVDYPVSGKSYLRVPAAFSIVPQAEGAWINLAPEQDYFINYLLNTEHSGDAKITIETLGATNPPVVFTASSTNGWTRKIHRFNSGNRTATRANVQIRIHLSSGDGRQGAYEGQAYFDDINIEPVLQVGDNQYVARECRLYPTNSSLSCKDQNKNVISNGLEGYCLERDKNNEKVCTTWYPADRISSSLLGNQSLGYSGPSSLSYCTNVNSNIKFAKKITTKLVYNVQDRDSTYYIRDGGRGNVSCNPGEPNCELVAGVGGVVVDVDWDWCEVMSVPDARTFCGDEVNYKAVHVNSKESWNNEFIYCVPRDNVTNDTPNPNFLFGVGPLTTALASLPWASALDQKEGSNCDMVEFYKEAWVQVNGYPLLNQHPASTCNDQARGTCEAIDEASNANPPLRIFDPNFPAIDEQGLSYLAADSGDREKVFNFTCNNFAQVVSSSGANKAWAVRTGITADPRWATSTPIFFGQPENLHGYGRQRNGIPFGAAVIPEDFDILNSGPIYLQNQYYVKDKQTISAGRPYGCTGTSCINLGYCSENPNVMCVFMPNQYTVQSDVAFGATGYNDAEYINKKTCADGGFGVCRPLWNNPSGLDTKNILSNIFLQSYGSFKYDAGGYIPDNYFWNASSMPANQGASPSICNVVLKYNGIDNGMQVDRSGVYSLEFNTIVNPEHQPLRMIVIDWGDGTRQAITGEDHRPEDSNPHIVYHYYTGDIKDFKLQIKIWDNWDHTGSY